MHTVLASVFFVAMLFGYDEPPPEAAAPRPQRPEPAGERRAAARGSLDAEVRDGKLIVSYAGCDGEAARVGRVVLHELTSVRYAWDWQVSPDGGRTWVTVWHAAAAIAEEG